MPQPCLETKKSSNMTGVAVLFIASIIANAHSVLAAPRVCFLRAAEYSMPGYIDSNIPSIWVDNAGTPNLRIFESGAFSHFYLQTPRLTEPETSAPFEFGNSRWLEGIVRDPKNSTLLWGYYHSEEYVPKCERHLPSPRVGAVYSIDDGDTWTPAKGGSEWVLRPPDEDVNCDAENGDFVSGNTDPTVILDEDVDPEDLHRYIYLFYVNAGGPVSTQGISAARVAIDTYDPTVAQKWDGKTWTGIGDGGPSVPISPDFNIIPRETDWSDTYQTDWSRRNPQSWYAPQVVYNTKLQKYVLIVSHTIEGISYYGTDTGWISFSDSLSAPNWSRPELIDTQAGYYYIQLFGLAPGETTSRVSEEARYFRAFGDLSYRSTWIAHFYDDADSQDPPPNGCILPIND